jgi:hypothetical protein
MCFEYIFLSAKFIFSDLRVSLIDYPYFFVFFLRLNKSSSTPDVAFVLINAPLELCPIELK